MKCWKMGRDSADFNVKYVRLEAAASERTLEWGIGEARPTGPRAGVGFLGRGSQSIPDPHQLEGLGNAVSSPAGSGAEPRPLKGFLVFCVVRLPSPASQYVLHAVSIGRY